MTIRTNTPKLFDNPRIPVQAKLAAAWTSLMYLVLYIDYFHLYQPDQIDIIRGGNIFTFEISGNLMTIFFVLISTPALMVLLSLTLPARVNRATNLVAAALWIPFCVVNAAGAPQGYALYYGVTIGVEVLILVFILRSAWTWPRTSAVAADSATADLRK
ncbi:DUF6326 family protein [Salinibacterium sp. TMP30]|uniref:DUF6326 family protein n=1 Tax=Salinibacterium sp. TMP30 TaxID=3138237 RepID=UPI003139E62E